MKFYAQFDSVTKKVYAVVQSDRDLSGANIVEAPTGYAVLGKTWNGSVFV